MNIAIIGSGNVGSALGAGWITSGHNVRFGVRNPESPKTQKAASEIQSATFTAIEEACSESDVIVITTLPEAVLALIPLMGSLDNKVVIDTTNAIRSRPEPFATAFEALRKVGNAPHVAKCFNSTGFENMKDPIYSGEGIDMFVSSSSEKATAVAKQLSADLGFGECYYFGGENTVEALEKFAFAWINLAIMQGHGRDLAFKVIRR